jgi:hypothetical protein
MPIDEHAERPYRIDDANAMSFSGTMHLIFQEREAVFAAFDPDFAPPFAANWKAATELAYDQYSDELTVDELAGFTEEVNKAIKQGRSTMADLRFFVHKAFGTKGLAAVFNFKAHDRLTRQPANYIIYLRVQHAMAQQFSAQLTAKGMTPAQIAAIAAAADQLAAAELAQETFKRERLRRTVQRKDVMAAMWAYLQQVHRAAQVIYAEDEVMRNIFALDPPNH